MREPREAECLAVLHEVGPVLEETLRIARSAPLVGSNNIVEGPLTWRFFDRKSLKTGSGMVIIKYYRIHQVLCISIDNRGHITKNLCSNILERYYMPTI